MKNKTKSGRCPVAAGSARFLSISKCADCPHFTLGFWDSDGDRCEHPKRTGKRRTPRNKIPANCPLPNTEMTHAMNDSHTQTDARNGVVSSDWLAPCVCGAKAVGRGRALSCSSKKCTQFVMHKTRKQSVARWNELYLANVADEQRRGKDSA